MGKLTIIVGIAFALTIAVVAGLWGSSSASAQIFRDSKCYRIKQVESERPYGQLIYISDQFEQKNLIVKRPVTFCAEADKVFENGIGGGPEPSDLVCYGIKDAPHQPRFRPTTVDVADQFGLQRLLLTKADSLCEPADKAAEGGSPAGFDGSFLDSFEFKCYRVRRLENRNSFEKIELTVFDQFTGPDGKEARLGRPVLFCTQVIDKKNKAKNDHIEHIRSVGSPDEYHASTIGAGSDRSDPPMSCAPNYGHSVFFTFTPGANGLHTFDTFDSTYDTVMAIYRADDPPVELDCNDNLLLDVDLQAGVKYIIVVGSPGGGPGGKLKFHVDVPLACAGCRVGSGSGEGEAAAPAPPMARVCYALSQRAPESPELGATDQLNAHVIELGRGNMYCADAEKKAPVETDDIEDAGTLTPGIEVRGLTVDATSDEDDPDCGGHSYGHSVWYAYDFDGNSKEFTVDTYGSSYDTVLGVYTGSPGNLQEEGCNDDDIGLTSSLTIETKAGPQTYYILIGAFGSNDGGKLKLHVGTAGCAACP